MLRMDSTPRNICRGVHRIFIYLGLAKREMSDGGYWVLGFLVGGLACMFCFVAWGVLHV
jgi:hypothetical protein